MEPTFFSNFNPKEARMAATFTDENLIKAVEAHDTYDDVHNYLAKLEKVQPGDIPKITVKNAVQRLMIEQGKVALKQLKPYVGVQKGYAPKMYAERTRLGVMIPNHLLSGTDFAKAQYAEKKKIKDGAKFDVKVAKKTITLTLKE